MFIIFQWNVQMPLNTSSEQPLPPKMYAPSNKHGCLVDITEVCICCIFLKSDPLLAMIFMAVSMLWLLQLPCEGKGAFGAGAYSGLEEAGIGIVSKVKSLRVVARTPCDRPAIPLAKRPCWSPAWDKMSVREVLVYAMLIVHLVLVGFSVLLIDKPLDLGLLKQCVWRSFVNFPKVDFNYCVWHSVVNFL